MAYTRQSSPESGLGSLVKVFTPFEVFPSLLESEETHQAQECAVPRRVQLQQPGAMFKSVFKSDQKFSGVCEKSSDKECFQVFENVF